MTTRSAGDIQKEIERGGQIWLYFGQDGNPRPEKRVIIKGQKKMKREKRVRTSYKETYHRRKEANCVFMKKPHSLPMEGKPDRDKTAVKLGRQGGKEGGEEKAGIYVLPTQEHPHETRSRKRRKENFLRKRKQGKKRRHQAEKKNSVLRLSLYPGRGGGGDKGKTSKRQKVRDLHLQKKKNKKGGKSKKENSGEGLGNLSFPGNAPLSRTREDVDYPKKDRPEPKRGKGKKAPACGKGCRVERSKKKRSRKGEKKDSTRRVDRRRKVFSGARNSSDRKRKRKRAAKPPWRCLASKSLFSSETGKAKKGGGGLSWQGRSQGGKGKKGQRKKPKKRVLRQMTLFSAKETKT